ncbi:MAG: hypothetical protein NVSMB39_1590 [Candidatus Saccharimonadales bacterium]
MSIKTLAKKAALSLQAMALMLSMGTATVAGIVVSAAPAMAACTNPDPATGTIQDGANCAQPNGTSGNLFATGGIFQTIANVLIFLVGAIAVIYLIIGGLRYVTSGGDAKAVSAAKDTILYAVIGIVVAVISFALVSFVISSLAKAQ